MSWGSGDAEIARPLGWSLLGNVAWSVTQWLVLVVLARQGTPAMVGQYALGLAISTPVVLLAGLALRTVLVTDAGTGLRFGDYLRLRVIGMLVALAVIVLVAVFIGPADGAVVALAGCAKALDGVGDIYFGLLQRRNQMDKTATSMAINGVATVVVAYCMVRVTGSVVAVAAGSVAASAAGVVYCARAVRPLPSMPCRQSGGMRRPSGGVPHRSPPGPLRGLLGTAMPLGIASGMASLTYNVPRYLLLAWFGTETLGIFAVLGYAVLITNLVFGSLAQVVLFRFTQVFAAGQTGALVRLARRLLLLALVAGAIAVPVVAVAGGPVLAALYGPVYAAHADVLVLLTVAATLGGVVHILNAALSAGRRFVNQLAVNATTTASSVAMGLLLVPRAGLAGAAVTMIVSTGGEALLKSVTMLRMCGVSGGTRAENPGAGAEAEAGNGTGTNGTGTGIGNADGRRRSSERVDLRRNPRKPEAPGLPERAGPPR